MTAEEWSSLGPEQQAKLLERMKTPTSNQYRAFHTAMTQNALIVNKAFKAKYEEVVSLRMKKSQTTGKHKEIRELCKMWMLARDNFKGELSLMMKSGFFTRSHWNSQENIVEDSPWQVAIAITIEKLILIIMDNDHSNNNDENNFIFF